MCHARKQLAKKPTLPKELLQVITRKQRKAPLLRSDHGNVSHYIRRSHGVVGRAAPVFTDTCQGKLRIEYLVNSHEDESPFVLLLESGRLLRYRWASQLSGDDGRLDAAVHGLDRYASPVVEYVRVTFF